MKKAICLLLLASSLAQAGGRAVELKKGDPAPYAGVLLDEEMAAEARKSDQKVPLLEERVKLLTDQNLFHVENYDLWRKEAERQSLQLQKSEDRTLLYFFAGILVTLGAAYAVGQVSK